MLPTLIQKYVRTGKLRIEYHSLETATREPEVFKTQQEAAYAAGKQNLGWYFIETFYHEQGEEDSGYVNEKIPPRDRLAGSRAEPRRLDRRAQRTDVLQRGHRRRTGRQPGRLHRHAVLRTRQDRRHA